MYYQRDHRCAVITLSWAVATASFTPSLGGRRSVPTSKTATKRHHVNAERVRRLRWNGCLRYRKLVSRTHTKLCLPFTSTVPKPGYVHVPPGIRPFHGVREGLVKCKVFAILGACRFRVFVQMTEIFCSTMLCNVQRSTALPNVLRPTDYRRTMYPWTMGQPWLTTRWCSPFTKTSRLDTSIDTLSHQSHSRHSSELTLMLSVNTTKSRFPFRLSLQTCIDSVVLPEGLISSRTLFQLACSKLFPELTVCFI